MDGKVKGFCSNWWWWWWCQQEVHELPYMGGTNNKPKWVCHQQKDNMLAYNAFPFRTLVMHPNVRRGTYPCCLLQDECAEYVIVVISQPLNTASVERTRSVNKKNMSVVAFHMLLLLLPGYLPHTLLCWTGAGN